MLQRPSDSPQTVPVLQARRPRMGDGPTGYIRGLSVRKTPTGVMRTLLVVSGEIPLHDEVAGSANTVSAWKPPGARRHLPDFVHRHRAEGTGATSPRHAAHLGIMRLRDDAWRSNRTPLVLTQVDPRNKPSMDLFSASDSWMRGQTPTTRNTICCPWNLPAPIT